MTGRRIETLQAKRPLDVTVFDTATLQTIVLGCSDLKTYSLLAADQARELARALIEAADILEPRGGVIPPVVPAVERRSIDLPPATPREDGVMLGCFDSSPRQNTPVLVGMGAEDERRDDWHGRTEGAQA